MDVQKHEILNTKEGVSISAVWTASGALMCSQDVSDQPETPGSPNMG